MRTFRDFSQWYKNKDAVPPLEVLQNLVEFHNNKGNELLELGCTLQNLATRWLQKSATAKFYPFIEINKDLLEKKREDMAGGPSIVLTRKPVCERDVYPGFEKLLQVHRWNWYWSALSFLYVSSNANCSVHKMGARFRIWGSYAAAKKTMSFEKMAMSYFQQVRPQCKVESFYTTATQKKIDAYLVDGFCGRCKSLFEAMGCYYHSYLSQEARPSLTEEKNQKIIRKRELDKLRKQYIQSVMTSFRYTNVIGKECTRLIK